MRALIAERYPLDGPIPGPYGRLADVYRPELRYEPRAVARYWPKMIMPYLSTEWLREHTRTDIQCRVCHVTPRDRLDQVGQAAVEHECSKCVQGLTNEAKTRTDIRRADRKRDQDRLRQQNRRSATSPQEASVTLEAPERAIGQTPPLSRDRASCNSASDRQSSRGVSGTAKKGGRPRKWADETDRKRAYRARRKEAA